MHQYFIQNLDTKLKCATKIGIEGVNKVQKNQRKTFVIKLPYLSFCILSDKFLING
jgi:hypothetical protein